MDLQKHRDIFNPSQLNGGSVGIIGVGALGSAVALEIAKLGVEKITLYDFDTVAAHNLPNQILYGPDDIEQLKIDAAYEAIYKLTGTKVMRVNLRLEKVQVPENFIFCCVDSMQARRQIFENCVWRNMRTRLYVEGRMNANTGYSYLIDTTDPKQIYQYTDSEILYSDDDVEPSRGTCGVTLSIGPTAHILAGIMVWQFMLALKDESKVGETYFTVDPWEMRFRPFERSIAF